jgi:hypothetical protein
MFEVPWAKTFRVFRYGIVNVSKRNDVLAAFDTKAPFTDKVSDTLLITTFAKGVTSEFRFEIADTFKDPANSDAVFKVVIFAIGAERLVVRLAKFEIVRTFRVEIFAIGAERLVVRLAKFEIVRTLRVVTFAIGAERLVVRLAKFEIVRTLRVVTFAIGAERFVVRLAKFEIVRTLRVVTFAIGA